MTSESHQSGFVIYYINLDRSPERRQRLENELSRFGLLAERVSAVDGSVLSQNELSAHYDAHLNSGEYFAPLKTSEIACFLSHRKVLRKFIEESDSDFAMVLEDDAEFVCDPKPLLGSLAAALHGKKSPVVVKLYAARPISAEPVANLTNGFVLTYPDLPPLVTVAQVFNRAGAEVFLQSTERFALPVDVAIQLWWKFPIQVLTVQPNLVTHQAEQVGGSTITTGKRLGIAAKLLREISRPFYRFRVLTKSRIKSLKKIPF